MNESIKEIYLYSINYYNMRLQSKAHLEVKCLYILQAFAFLVTLFVGLLTGKNSIWLLHLKYAFYATSFFSIILLLLALEDGILNWFRSDQSGLPLRMRFPVEILESTQGLDIDMYYIDRIEEISSCLERLEEVLCVKYNMFKWGLRLFIVSLSILLAIGISIMNL